MAVRSMCPTICPRFDLHNVLKRRALCFEHRHELLCEINATKRRREHPVAIPLTPPSGFVNAVTLAPIRTDATSSRTFARGQAKKPVEHS